MQKLLLSNFRVVFLIYNCGVIYCINPYGRNIDTTKLGTTVYLFPLCIW